MKVYREIFLISFTFLSILLISGCDTTAPEESSQISYQEIQMDGLDKFFVGGQLEAVITSQSQYDSLIYSRFQKPLADYWTANYEAMLEYVKIQNPGLTENEYKALVKEIFFSSWPFEGTENYTHPQIDFSKYTLLGQDANSGGCETPDYKVEIKKDGFNVIYRLTVIPKGYCEMAILKNMWILIPKLPKGYSVKFEKTLTR
ncbi:MAG: hypothetical protein WAV89_00660 [Ignavibacteriaceae bacterium]